jgi:hypothetical protein
MDLSFGTDCESRENYPGARMPPSMHHPRLQTKSQGHVTRSPTVASQKLYADMGGEDGCSTTVAQSTVPTSNTDSLLSTHHALIQTLAARIDQFETLQAAADSKQRDLVEMCNLFQ